MRTPMACLRKGFALLLLIAVVFPIIARAYLVTTTTKDFQFSTLSVESGNGEYTGLSSDILAFTWGANVHVHVDGLPEILHWSFWPVIQVPADDPTGAIYELSAYDAHDNYQSTDQPQGSVDVSVGNTIPNTPQISAWFADRCNDLADELRAEGKPDSEIFSIDRAIPLGAQLAGVIELIGSGSPPLEEATASGFDPKSEIICLKNATLPTDDISVNDNVKNATLLILESATMGGACQVTLSSVIETYSPDIEVAFRYIDDNGNESDVKNVATDDSKKAYATHTYAVPNNPDGGESGSIYMKILSGDPMISNIAQYEMDCTEAAAQDYATELPPQLSLSVAPVDNVMVGDWLCPSKLVMAAGIASYSELDAEMIFAGNNYLSAPQPVSQGYGEVKNYFGYRDLSWNSNPTESLSTGQPDDEQPASQQMKLWFSVFDGDDTIAILPWQNYQVTCTSPDAQFDGPKGGLVSEPPPADESGQIVGLTAGEENQLPKFGSAVPKAQPTATDAQRTAAINPTADVGVFDLTVTMREGRGVARGTLRNNGQSDSEVRYILRVNKSKGQRVALKSDALTLKPGKDTPVSTAFRVEPGTRYEAVLQINVFGDSNPVNNRMVASAASKPSAGGKVLTAPLGEDPEETSETDERIVDTDKERKPRKPEKPEKPEKPDDKVIKTVPLGGSGGYTTPKQN